MPLLSSLLELAVEEHDEFFLLLQMMEWARFKHWIIDSDILAKFLERFNCLKKFTYTVFLEDFNRFYDR